MTTILTSLAGLLLGAFVGRVLAARGVTAADALVGRQRLAYLILLFSALVALALYYSYRLWWLPSVVVLYGEVLLYPLVQVLASFAIGFIALLEWPGRRDRVRLRNLIGPVVLLTIGVGFLAYRSQPVINNLRPSFVVDGVVMQTTPYTCSSASIATLARVVFRDTTFSERRVAEVAGTTRAGTNTLLEIRAMRALGLDPRFGRRLTIDSLVAAGGFAVLHVNEPVLTGTIRHAVALLAVDTLARTVTLGNPLYGRQVKRFEDLDEYWYGEAVFVGRPGTRS